MAGDEYAKKLSKIVQWVDMNLREHPVNVRRDVVLNLVKNVMLDVVEQTTPPNVPGYFEAYEKACDDFAEQVMWLPDQYRALRATQKSKCGKCPQCLAEQKQQQAEN